MYKDSWKQSDGDLRMLVGKKWIGEEKGDGQVSVGWG
jgi:hypothetical protein